MPYTRTFDLDALLPRTPVTGADRASFANYFIAGGAFPMLKDAVPVPIADVAEPPKRERPKLPEGMTYFNDEDDWLTVSDIPADKEHLYLPKDHAGNVMVWRNQSTHTPTTDRFSSRVLWNYRSGVYNRGADFMMHIIRTPVDHAGYFHNLADSAIFTALYAFNHPWASKEWWNKALPLWVEHMPAFSKDHEGYLMYFQNADKRARGIRTPIKPARYLKKLFADVLTEQEIQDFGLEWTTMSKPPVAKVTQDADEIEAVYRGAYLGSCMHFKSGTFEGSEHPARVYAGPDLGIAYIGPQDNAAARVLVWPDKKLYFPKFYGDYHRMKAAIEALGYEEGSEDDFVGSRLQRIPYGGGFVAPYLDFCEGVDDDGTWLVTTHNHDIGCRNTCGLSDRAGYLCAYTGERYSSDGDLQYVDGYGDVGENALEEYFFLDVITEEYFHNDDRHPDTHPDYPISIRTINRRHQYTGQIFYCSYSEQYLPKSDFDYVEMANGDLWEEDAFHSYGSTCEFSNENYPDDEVTVLDNGRIIATDLYDLEDDKVREFAGLEPLQASLDLEEQVAA